MKDRINLKGLKRSKVRKHVAIYEKAHRIMIEGCKTPDLTQEEILSVASQFPTLTASVMVGGDISVKSKKDSWLIRDEHRFYTLYHSGLIFDNGKAKDRYHIQDIFKDLNFIFASIVSHDDYTMGIKKRNMNDLLELAEA